MILTTVDSRVRRVLDMTRPLFLGNELVPVQRHPDHQVVMEAVLAFALATLREYDYPDVPDDKKAQQNRFARQALEAALDHRYRDAVAQINEAYQKVPT